MPRREQLEKMLEADPDDVFLNYALALACIAEGETADGLDRLSQVIDRDPKYVAAYFQSGQVLAETGETDAAREIVARGVEVAQTVGDSHAEMEMTAFLESLQPLSE
ncbi:MAG: tetratricopeptide repeat protein [Planctomycetes bacterium]|nr:tetratricopeptide repeat protein [Planctomycetota bacterium]